MEFWPRQKPALGDDAISLSRIPVTAAAGLVTAITAAHKVATNASGSASAPTSSLGRLISRTGSSIRHRPVLGRSQRRDPDLTPNTIGVFPKSRKRKTQTGPRRAAKARCAVPMSNMPLQTDKGRSTLGRSSTSRDRAAFEMNEGRRAARQCYYRPSRNGPCS